MTLHELRGEEASRRDGTWISLKSDAAQAPGALQHSEVNEKLFFPTARQTNWLLIVGFLALGEALYLRYLAIEHTPVALACQSGLDTWLCGTFRLAIVLYTYSVFGWVALIAAALNFLRPSIVLTSLTLAAAAFGLVMHNAGLSGLAAAVLVLSLARPAPRTDEALP